MPKVFKDKEFRNNFFRLFFPILFQELLVVLINTIGSFIIGAVSQAALSGINIASNVFIIYNTALVGVAITGSVFAAQYDGNNEKEKIAKLFNLVLKIGTILSLIFMIICMCLPTQIMSIFAPNDPEVIAYGAKYIRYFSISFIFRGISAMYFYSVKNLGKTKIIIITSLVTLVVNIGLTCALVLGANLDTLGAAIALIVSRFVEMMIIIIYSRKFPECKVKIKWLLHSDKGMLSKVLKYIATFAFSRLIWAVGSIMAGVILGRLTADIVAANSLILICRNIVNCTAVASATAASILLARELGANKLEKASEHGDELMKCNFLIGAANIALFYALCGLFFLIGMNTLTDGAKTYLWQMMLIYSISIIPQSYNGLCLDGIFSAGGDKIFIALNNILVIWLISVPLGFVSLHFNWPPLLTFFLILSDELIKFPIALIRYRQKKWLNKIV